MLNIAVDGPAGAGKSSAAKAVAKKLGIIYVDTGALYRAVGVNALRRGVDPKDRDGVRATLHDLHIDLRFTEEGQKVFVDGHDVTEEIRLPESSMASSDVSAFPEVRAFLLTLQRDIAAKNDCIMDGRDIGTVILPDAKPKIFLTASPEVRTKRRREELAAKGIRMTFEELLEQIKQRDRNDSTRKIAPLRPAEDAVMLDSTDMTLEQVVDKICAIVRESTGENGAQ